MTLVRRQGTKNTVYSYIGIILGVISTLYIQPFFLTKEQIGITRSIISAATILAVASNLGTTIVNIKFLPYFFNPEKKHNGFFTVALLFPLFGFFIIITLLFLFKDSVLQFLGVNAPIFKEYTTPIFLITIFHALITSLSTYCNAINKSSLSTIVNEVANRVLFIVSILLFSYGMLSQNGYVYSIALAFLIQLSLIYFIINHFDYPYVTFSFFRNNPHVKKIISFGLTSSFIQIAGIGLKYLDVIFVGKYESMKEVGVYSIAVFIGLVLETPLNAIERIAGPKIARLYAANNHNEIEKVYKLSTKYLMLFCGFIGAGIIVCIHPLLELLPNDYSSGAWVTIIICIGAFFNSSTGVNYSIITYSNFYRLSAIFYSVLLVLTIFLNIYLIPLYGITGAAVAIATASVFHNLLRYLFIKFKLNMQPFSIESLKLIFVILISTLLPFLIQLDNKYMLILTRGMTCSIIFIGLVIVLGIFSVKEIKQEIASFKKTFI